MHSRCAAVAFIPRRTVLATALLLAAAPTLAEAAPAANPVDFDTVVVTAAGFEQKITDAPASISVITREDLERRQFGNLAQALREVEGVDIGQGTGKTGGLNISIRGMPSAYTLVLVDGRRQNNGGDITPNGFGETANSFMPPLAAIERIEVIRGPMSTLYGADAMGGVINIITRKTLDTWAGSFTLGRTFETDDVYGDDRTADAYVTGPLLPGRLSLAARASWYRRDASNPVYADAIDPAGETHSRSLGFGGGGKTVDNTNKAGGITLTWTPDERQSLSFDYDSSRQEYDNAIRRNDAGVEEYPVGTVDNYGAVLRIGNNGRVEPRVGYAPQQRFTRDTWSLSHEGSWAFGNTRAVLSRVETRNEGRTLPFTVAERRQLQSLWNAACTALGGAVGDDGFCPLAGTGYASSNAWNNQSEADKLAILQANLGQAAYQQLLGFLPRPARTLESSQYTLDLQADVPFQAAGGHMLVFGGQVVRGELSDGVFGMEAGRPGGVQDHDMYSLFVEDTWTIAEPFALTGGVRYDHHDAFGSQVSPRLYGVYTINPRWTVKGGASTGFKTPRTTDLYDGVVGFGAQGTIPFFGNPDLQPETSRSLELAVYWQHPGGHDFNATVFHNTFEDKISSQPCGPGTAQPCSSTGEYADLGYANSNRTVNIDEVVIQGAELSGRWQVTDAVSLRANYTHTDSEQKSGAQAGLPLTDAARHMANATLDWQATGRLRLFLKGEARSRRFSDLHPVTGEERYYRDYTVLHLGGSYAVNEAVTVNARINNLLDRDFTTYDTQFADLDGDGVYEDGTNEVIYFDHYNNKDKARSVWLSVNVRF